jgi:hypothetical protein
MKNVRHPLRLLGGEGAFLAGGAWSIGRTVVVVSERFLMTAPELL